MAKIESGNPKDKITAKIFHSRWMKAVSVMAGIVVFCTTYALILPAITMSAQDAKCGYEEHTHAAECYDAEGNIICGIEEHVHSLECYSDLYADIENPDEWSAEIPALSGERNANVVDVAWSQIGYRESDSNYLVSDGDQTQGYTRYGHWYGDVIDGSGERLENGLSSFAYADWDAMFVSFVLDNAGVYDFGYDYDAGNWAGALAAAGRYTDAADYIPEAGDLIFFTPEAGAGIKVGIVTDVNKGFLGMLGDEVKSISVIVGNSNNSVEEIKVAVADYNEGDVVFEKIHGYGILTPKEEVMDESVSSDVLTSDQAEAELGVQEEVPVEEAAEQTGEGVSEEQTVTEESEATDTSESEYVTDITDDNNHIIGADAEDLETVEITENEGVRVTVGEATVSDDSETIVMNWQVDAQLDAGLSAGSIIRVDTASGKEHALTVAELKAWGGSARINEEDITLVDNDDYEVTFIGSSDQLYTWANVQSMEDDAVTTFTGLQIKALSDITEGNSVLSLHFETTARLANANVGQNYYVTKASVDQITGSATYTFANGEAVPADQDKILQDANLDAATVREDTLIAKGSDYTVTMTYGADACIPDIAKLKATEIKEGTEAYDNYITAAKVALGLNEDDMLDLCGRFFDIKIMTKDGEFEPKAPVSVNISYSEAITDVDSSDVSAVHIAGDGAEEVKGEPDVVNGDIEGVDFEAESFSVYGIVYIVDFEYDGYKYSLQGGESVKLVDALGELGIEIENSDILKAEFTNAEYLRVYAAEEDIPVTEYVEDFPGSDGDLSVVLGSNADEYDEAVITVDKIDAGTWMLDSIQSFTSKEMLTVETVEGEIYKIQVTDPLNSEGYLDLTDPANGSVTVTTDESVTSTEQDRNAAFDIYVSFNLTAQGLADLKTANPYTMVYDFQNTLTSSSLADSISDASGKLTVGRTVVGDYKIINNIAYITITNRPWLASRINLRGSFDFTVQTDATQLGDKDEETYYFPGDTTGIHVRYKKSINEGYKQYSTVTDSDGNYIIHYTANVQVNSTLDTLTFTDTLSGLQKLEQSSVKINGTPVADFTSVSTSGFEFSVNNALHKSKIDAGSYQVSYDAKLSKTDLETMTADQTIERNVAKWVVNGNKVVKGGDTTIPFNKPTPPTPDLEKTATPSNGGTVNPDGTITYTVTYGASGEDVGGVTIHDWMTDAQVLVGNSIQVTGGVTTTLTEGNGLTYHDDNKYSLGTTDVFNYTIPAGTVGPVVFTYTTRVISQQQATANGIYDTVTVSNVAHESKSNKQPTTEHHVPFEKEPQVPVTKGAQSSSVDGQGNWTPGAVITYTITIGDSSTLLDGLNITDKMTDLQIYNTGSIHMTVRGTNTALPEGAVVYNDDGKYGINDVDVLSFTFPSGTGYGPAVITYTTTVASEAQAGASQIYGEVTISNTATGGNGKDGTEGTVPYPEMELDKDVLQENTSVDGQPVATGSTLHYKIEFGSSSKLMDNITISDEFTYLQLLTSDVTVTLGNGNSYVMPVSAHNYDDTGVIWYFYDDGGYSPDRTTPLFRYKLPEGTGYGPITVEYDTRIITDEEAQDKGIEGIKDVKNKVTVANKSDETVVKPEFPTIPKHEPLVTKKHADDTWALDLETNTIYWDIEVDKTPDSAWPLTNVTIQEPVDLNNVWYSVDYPSSYGFFKEVDMAHAVVTTESGTVLQPGVDYLIDKETETFTFPVLREKIVIRVGLPSPVEIVNSYKTGNLVMVNGNGGPNAQVQYFNPNITINKSGVYDESKKIVTWTVVINPGKVEAREDIEEVFFSDILPEGMDLVDYQTEQIVEHPRFYVGYGGNNYNTNDTVYYHAEVDDGKIKPIDIGVVHGQIKTTAEPQLNPYATSGLNHQTYTIMYKTKISDEEWDRITSSLDGSKDYTNSVKITTDGTEEFDKQTTVTIQSEDFITKTDTTPHAEGSELVVDADTGRNSNLISYSIDINPKRHVLVGNGKTLTLTDKIATNMDLNTDSVRIYKYSADDSSNVEIHNNEEINISYNDDSRIMTITGLPDETHLVITYNNYARADGKDTFENTCVLYGGGSHSAHTEVEHVIQAHNAAVEGESLDLVLQKIDHDRITSRLAGAEFELHKIEFNNITDADWDELLAEIERNPEMEGYTNPKFSFDNSTDITLGTEHEGKYYTSDGTDGSEIGTILWSAMDGLQEKALFYWVETAAPRTYSGIEVGEKHYFVIYRQTPGENEQGFDPEEHQKIAWALDDTVQNTNGVRVASMVNTTVWTATNTKYASISVTKEWDDEDNYYETRPIKNGITYNLYQIDEEGNETLMSDVSPVTIRPDENGVWPTYTWTKLPLMYGDEGEKLYKYSVKEAPVENYSTTYSDNGEGLTTGTITVTNKMIPKTTRISVEKKFEPVNIEKPNRIIVDLMEIHTYLDGTVTQPMRSGFTEVLNQANNWKYTWEELATTGKDDNGDYYAITYTVNEREVPGFDFTVTYSDNQAGVLEATENDPLVITNTLSKVDVTIKKVGDDGSTPLTGAVFGLYKYDGSEYAIFENEDLTGGQFTVDSDIGKTISGLDSGRYRLTEITPPTDYVITEDLNIYFTVSGSTVTWTDDSGNPVDAQTDVTFTTDDVNNTFTVVNYKGYEFPHTGGIGTNTYRVAGIVMTIIAFLGVLVLRGRGRRYNVR